MADKLGSKVAGQIVSVALKKSGVRVAKGFHVEIKRMFPNPSSRTKFAVHIVKGASEYGFSFKDLKPAIHPDATIGQIVYALAGLPGTTTVSDKPKKIPTIVSDILSGDIPKSIAALPDNPTVSEPNRGIPTIPGIVPDKGTKRKSTKSD